MCVLHNNNSSSAEAGEHSCREGAPTNNAEGRDIDWVTFWREYRLGSQLAEHKKIYP